MDIDFGLLFVSIIGLSLSPAASVSIAAQRWIDIGTAVSSRFVTALAAATALTPTASVAPMPA